MEFLTGYDVLPCKNGVIILNDGSLIEGKWNDYYRKIVPTRWMGLETTAPHWRKFLKSVFGDSDDLISYLKRLIGYIVAGTFSEHYLHLFVGQGRNGKGTFLETLQFVLGEFAGPIESEMLLKSKFGRNSGGPSSDKMYLKGKLLVWASETNLGKEFDLSVVKLLTGGDIITGRVPYGKYQISFSPTHTLILLTNHLPLVLSDDYAFWKRIRVIIFPFSFIDNPIKANEKQMDLHLIRKLKSEASGILAWIVQGCIEYRQQGLNPPECVIAATDKYRKSEDIVGQFLSEACTVSPEKKIRAGDLYKSFLQWCSENGLEPISNVKFANYIQKRFRRDDKGRHRYYIGVETLTGIYNKY